MAHKMNIRQERANEWRATCICGWTEKALTEGSAKSRAERHKKFPQRESK